MSTDQSPSEPLEPLQACQIPVATIKRGLATFRAVVLDFGLSHPTRFQAQGTVTRKETTTAWTAACRSESQARLEAENACRAFAADEERFMEKEETWAL